MFGSVCILGTALKPVYLVAFYYSCCCSRILFFEIGRYGTIRNHTDMHYELENYLLQKFNVRQCVRCCGRGKSKTLYSRSTGSRVIKYIYVCYTDHNKCHKRAKTGAV